VRQHARARRYRREKSRFVLCANNTFGMFGRGRLHRTDPVRRDRRQFGRPRSGIMTRRCCICGSGMAHCRRRASLQREPLIVGAFAASGARDLQGRPRPDAVRERCSQRVEQRLSGFFFEKKSQWRKHIEKKKGRSSKRWVFARCCIGSPGPRSGVH
jgi:hypothetical protein